MISCEEARRRIAEFVQRSLGGEAGRELRAHLTGCEDCARAYRETLATAARVGRGVRTEREAADRARRHRELKRLSRSVGETKRRPRFWLQLVLIPAALFFLLTRLPLLGEGSDLIALSGSGEAHAAGTPLGPKGPEVELRRGDVCTTGPLSRAEVSDGETTLALAERTDLLVEHAGSRDGPRVRLLGGAIEIDGPCVVTTQLGVLAVESGSARLALDAGTLEVVCTAGSARLVTSLGTHSLAAGETLSV